MVDLLTRYLLQMEFGTSAVIYGVVTTEEKRNLLKKVIKKYEV
jgi:hypothetical protein